MEAAKRRPDAADGLRLRTDALDGGEASLHRVSMIPFRFSMDQFRSDPELARQRAASISVAWSTNGTGRRGGTRSTKLPALVSIR